MNRNDWLKQIKDQLGNVERAVEVGVWRGDYSRFIIEHLQPKCFWGVDPYEIYNDFPDPDDFASPDSLEQLYHATLKRYDGWDANLIRSTSVDAAEQFEDNSIDFVYLDGDHVYAAVRADIAAWWPKIKPGGILSGHDYCNVNPAKHFGIIPAVDEHVAQYGLKLQTTHELYPSWWVTK
jgi:hypothetical protein